jgi:hypothetical protein
MTSNKRNTRHLALLAATITLEQHGICAAFRSGVRRQANPGRAHKEMILSWLKFGAFDKNKKP